MLKRIKERLKDLIAKIQHSRRTEELKRTTRHVTRQEITTNLCQMGIKQGDILFIHSSLKSLGFVPGGPKEVIAGLLDAVGSEGTLLLPTYYMPGGTIIGTCKMADYVFDPRIHGTNMGALPEAFLSTPTVCRSIHPTHSVSAIGKHARYLTEAHHLAPSVFGEGSPWQRFLELNGKVLGIGVSMGPITFYHLLEDTLGKRFPVAVWEEKSYEIPCDDLDGNHFVVPVRPYTAEATSRRIDQKERVDLRNYFRKEFEKANLLHCGQVGDASAWYIEAQAFLEHLKILSEQGITIYSTADQLLKRPN